MSPVEWPALSAWIANLIRKLLRRDSPTNRGQFQTNSPNARQANAGHDVYQAGGDIIISQQEPTRPSIPWPNRPGAPQFEMSPGISSGKLLCEFRISLASPAPGRIEARWIGVGTDMNWTRPMLQNVPNGANYQKYQMKPVVMKPTPPNDEVIFEVHFYLDDGQHGGRWIWPIHQFDSKGLWILKPDEGSQLHQPQLKDTW
jgi:hypothetical protein